jgi:23S rRNA pseudouridine2605 synthase
MTDKTPPPGGKKPFVKNGKKPFKPGNSSGGSKPARPGERKPFKGSASTGRPAYSKPYGERSEGGSAAGGDKRPFRKPYGERSEGGGSAAGGDKRPFRKPYGDRSEGGASAGGGGQRPFRKPYERAEGGSAGGGGQRPFRKPYERTEGGSAVGGDKRPFRKPYERAEGGSAAGGDKRPFRKPYERTEGGGNTPLRRTFDRAISKTRKPFNDDALGGLKRELRKSFEAKPETDGMPTENPKRFPRTRVMGRTDEMPYVRLNKWIADSGMCSRREADELILSGQVAVNRKVVRTLGTRVAPDQDEVTVAGRAIVPRRRKTYVLFHKPKDCIVTKSDPEGRQTIFAYLPPKYQHCDPVGRLDRDSTGLMLLSDDGEWVHQLSHPSYHMPKTYRVDVDLPITDKALKELKKGVPLEPEGVTAYFESLRWPDLRRLEVELVTGYNRQIRRMMDHVGYEVTRLKRTRLGPLTLDSLPPGSYRPLTSSELTLLKKTLPKPERPAYGNKPGFKPSSVSSAGGRPAYGAKRPDFKKPANFRNDRPPRQPR